MLSSSTCNCRLALAIAALSRTNSAFLANSSAICCSIPLDDWHVSASAGLLFELGRILSGFRLLLIFMSVRRTRKKQLKCHIRLDGSCWRRLLLAAKACKRPMKIIRLAKQQFRPVMSAEPEIRVKIVKMLKRENDYAH